jgi:hypothetical protein
LFESSRPFFDDPGSLRGFYPDAVMAAFDEGVESDALARAVAALEPLVELVPRSSGPARHLALILFRLTEFERAVSVLETACSRVVGKEAERSCRSLLARAQVNVAVQQADREPQQSFDTLVSEMQSEYIEEEEGAPDALVQVAVILAKATGEWDEHQTLRRALTSWHARKVRKPESAPTVTSTEPAATTPPWRRPVASQGQDRPGRGRQQVSYSLKEAGELQIPGRRPERAKWLDDAGAVHRTSERTTFDPKVDPHVITYLLAAAGAVGQGEAAKVNWRTMYEAMDGFLKAHACVSAVHYRMIAAVKLAESDPDLRGEYVPQARRDAQEVIASSTDTRERETAQQVLAATDRV